MAYGKSDIDYKRNAKNAKKADIIIELDSKISAKIDDVSQELVKTNLKLDAAMAELGRGKGVSDMSSAQISEVYAALHEEYESIKREMKFLAAQSQNIFIELSRKLEEIASSNGAPRAEGSAGIDYDKLAEKIAAILPAQEVISPDYIASKVAEQIAVPEAARATATPSESSVSPEAARVPVDLQLDEEELADRIALKIGGIKAEDFDILVDDEGCASISGEIVQKLDYDAVASSIAEKLRASLDYITEREPDYEELAHRISEKINLSGINEDAIAEKAVAAITGAVSEIDTDEIADKVASQLLQSLPAAEVDSDAIGKTVYEKLIEHQENHDYNIILDDNDVNKITKCVSEEILKNADARFDGIHSELAELKAMVAGTVVREAATSDAETYVAGESDLVTVSEIVDYDEKEDANEYGEAIAELVGDINEIPAENEVTPDDLSAEGGVDFENMMKYNRSFIARIIQSTDEQKEYYGRVKTALLSYAKVNSNIAWGAERFNKGRETIARFKIRGKTLCLYLALNPTDYQYSVYHHVDVSDNKSIHGTPMMIKIKSPRGVKKAIRLIDDMLEKRGGIKRTKSIERNYAAMYPYESIEELIEDGLVKDVSKS